MRNHLFFVFLCLIVISLLGCFPGGSLHPVQGYNPHDAEIKVSGVFNSGRFWVDFKAGQVFHSEECKGRWEPAGPPKPAGDPGNHMVAVWDTVYGAGYYATDILKAKQCARGSCMSKQGASLEAEICELEVEKNGKTKTIRNGVAKDNKNNIYRIDSPWL